MLGYLKIPSRSSASICTVYQLRIDWSIWSNIWSSCLRKLPVLV